MVGIGYWGPNLLRNFVEHGECKVVAICDTNKNRLDGISKKYPSIAVTTDLGALLADPQIEAMVIATPADTHFNIALQCLQSGKHVFVEKPLALNAEHCEILLRTSIEKNLCLMVGHTFLYNAAVVHIKQLIRSGAIGDVLYVYCQRLNLGKVRDDLDVVWNLAPHDISILCYWFDALPAFVRAKGYSYVQNDIADVAFITMDFQNSIGASIHVSWLDPNKTRLITVVGSKKMVVYDDISLDQKVVIYDKGISHPESMNYKAAVSGQNSFYDFKVELREGDILIPHLKVREPLAVECESFIRGILTKETPISSGDNGLNVVKVLQACSRSMLNNGCAEAVL